MSKKKALYLLKNKLSDKFLIIERGKNLELVLFEEAITIFPNWEKCYDYLKLFTKSTKRKYLESIQTSKILWDTDLEDYEQDLIKDIQEVFDYQYTSLSIEELHKISHDWQDEELNPIKDLIYSMEYLYKKDLIEIE